MPRLILRRYTEMSILQLALCFVLFSFNSTDAKSLISLGQGRCTEDTVLVCSGINTPFTWRIILDGKQIAGHDNLTDVSKYSVSVMSNSITLNIHTTDVTDVGKYSCEVAYDGKSEDKQLLFECQANATQARMTPGKRLQLSVEKLYPANALAILYVKQTGAATTSAVQLTRICTNSTVYTSYFNCTWTSSSLADGQYTYTLVVTTLTSTSRTGTVKVATPGTPQIVDIITESSRQLLEVDEGKQITFACTSSGGYPVQTVVLYFDNSQQASSNTGVLQNGLYTVDVSYTMTPSRSQDLKQICCNSSYPDADFGFKGQDGTCATLQLFLPPSEVTASQVGEVVSGSSVSVRCTAIGSRPASELSWSYKGTSSIPSVSISVDDVTFRYSTMSTYTGIVRAADNDQLIQCKATHRLLNQPLSSDTRLNVFFPALYTNITGATNIYADGVNKVTLTCTAGTSNPASNILWYRNNQQITSNESVKHKSGDYGGIVTSQVIQFAPTRELDSHVVECMAGNGLTSTTTQWARKTLDLKFEPIVSVNRGTVVIVETQSGSLSCTVDSKPMSTIEWTKVDATKIILSHKLPSESNSLEYSISSADREDAGQYRCTANNTYGGNKYNDTQLVVGYAPDVTVVTQNTTVNATSVDIRCYPSGVPATYKYITWEQFWPGYGLVRAFPGSDVLTLKNLTYEDNGVYTCKVENGVPLSKNTDAGHGQAHFRILSYPVILRVDSTLTVAVQIGYVSEFSVDFFSTTQDTRVFMLKENAESMSDIASTEIMSKQVAVKVFDHNIDVGGFVARTKLNTTKEEELGSYKLYFQNSIGSQYLTVNLISEGPPSSPTIISVTNIQQTSAVLTWTRGFHGGFSQTVYVELSVDRQRWNVKVKLNEGVNEDKGKVNTTLEQLQPGTLYYIRMYAENKRGESGRTRIFNLTSLKSDGNEETNALPLIVGGSVGGLAAGAFVLIIVIFVIKRWRSKLLGRRDDNSMLNSGHNLRSICRTKSDSTDGDDEVINPIYDGQDNNPQSKDNLHSQPIKSEHNRPAAGPSDIYAVVNKGKKDNTKVKRVKGGKANKGKTDEDVYVNSQRSAPEDENLACLPQKTNANQDGLLYADLVFANQPKGQKRLIIHGTDDMTEYAQVDLTKKSEALRESAD